MCVCVCVPPNPPSFFQKDVCGIKQPTKVDLPLHKETNQPPGIEHSGEGI